MEDIFDNNPAGFLRRFVDTGDGAHAECVVVAKPVYALLANTTETGPAVPDIVGGLYIWRCEAPSWNDAKAQLQFLALDGATWNPMLNAETSLPIEADVNSAIPIIVAQGMCLRVLVTGEPEHMNSTIAGY